MLVSLKAQPLKLCSTCRHWIYRYKGLCTILNQGVGRFWRCEDWAAADDRPVPAAPAAPPPILPTP